MIDCVKQIFSNYLRQKYNIMFRIQENKNTTMNLIDSYFIFVDKSVSRNVSKHLTFKMLAEPRKFHAKVVMSLIYINHF